MANLDNTCLGAITTEDSEQSNYEAGYVFTPVQDIYVTKLRVKSYIAVNEILVKIWDYDTQEILNQSTITTENGDNWFEGEELEKPIRLFAKKKYILSMGGQNRRVAAIANIEVNPNIQIIEGCYSQTVGNFPTIVDATKIYALVDMKFTTFDYKYLVRNIQETTLSNLSIIDIDKNLLIEVNEDTNKGRIYYSQDTVAKILYFPLAETVEYTFNITGSYNKCIAGTIEQDPEDILKFGSETELIRVIKNEPLLDGTEATTINFKTENGEKFFVAYLSDNEADNPMSNLQGKGNYQLYTYDETTFELTEIQDFIINAELFSQYGKSTISLLNLMTNNPGVLSYPSVLYWEEELGQEQTPALKAEVEAIPKSQIIISDKVDLSHSTIAGINNITIEGQGDIKIAVSLDKETWKMWGSEQEQWIDLTSNQPFAGMSITTIQDLIIEPWNELIFDENGNKVDGIYFRIAITEVTQSIKNIYVNFINNEY